MKDIHLHFNLPRLFRPYISMVLHIQLKKPFLVKKWQYITRSDGFNVHLFPFHFHFNKYTW